MEVVKLSIVVQEEALDSVLVCLRELEVGSIGNYTNCIFITKGVATFQPNEIAEPTVGHKMSLNSVSAAQIQTWCDKDKLKLVLEAIKQAHPNEEPAVEIVTAELA